MDRAYSEHRWLFSCSHLLPISLFLPLPPSFLDLAFTQRPGEISSHISAEDYFSSVIPVGVTKEQKTEAFLIYSHFHFTHLFIVWRHHSFSLQRLTSSSETNTGAPLMSPPRIRCDLRVSETQRTSIHETLINKTWGGSFVWQVDRTGDYFCR